MYIVIILVGTNSPCDNILHCDNIVTKSFMTCMLNKSFWTFWDAPLAQCLSDLKMCLFSTLSVRHTHMFLAKAPSGVWSSQTGWLSVWQSHVCACNIPASVLWQYHYDHCHIVGQITISVCSSDYINMYVHVTVPRLSSPFFGSISTIIS